MIPIGLTNDDLSWQVSNAGMRSTSWAMADRAAMSQICMRGLVGDSSITSLVRPGISAALTALPHTQQYAADMTVGRYVFRPHFQVCCSCCCCGYQAVLACCATQPSNLPQSKGRSNECFTKQSVVRTRGRRCRRG